MRSGAQHTHLKIAEDLVVIAQLGYLQAALLNRRYPWSDRDVLRSACVNQTLLMVERCLINGGDVANFLGPSVGPRRPRRD